MKPAGLGEDHIFSNLVDRCHIITNKELYPITETLSLEDF